MFRSKKGTNYLVKLHVTMKILDLQSLVFVILKITERFCFMLKNGNILNKRSWVVLVIHFFF
jgi:hypothetical protein